MKPVPLAAAVIVLGFAGTAFAPIAKSQARTPTFRCESGGRITYGDRPCAADQHQSAVTIVDDAPSSADRAQAASRARRDQVALASLERDRAEREARERRDATARARLQAADDRKRDACTRLALRTKRAHDEFNDAGPSDYATRRNRMNKADDDYAARCRAAR